jgi:U3 small nucleolar RNA-associated protein 10
VTKRGRLLLVLEAVVSVVGRAVMVLPSFLGSGLATFALLLTHPALVGTEESVLPDSLRHRASSARSAMATRVPVRLLFAALFQQLPTLGKNPRLQTGEQLVALVDIVKQAVAHADKPSLKPQVKAIFKFGQHMFGYRHVVRSARMPLARLRVSEVEAGVTECLVNAVMKMSDSSFRPLFLQLVDWAAQDPKQGRWVPCFRLVHRLAAQLRQFFVPYFSHLLKTAVDILLGAAAGDATENHDGVLLKHLVLAALTECFTHDVDGFLTKERFESLLGPLCQQLERQQPDREDGGAGEEPENDVVFLRRVKSDVLPCLTALAAAVDEPGWWKKLNDAVRFAGRLGGDGKGRRNEGRA